MKSDVNFSYLTFLSVVAAIGGFLFGYDAAVISGTISQVTAQFGLDEIQVDNSSRVRSMLFSYICTFPRSRVMDFRGSSTCLAIR